ncbi:MAG: hypothetical protein IPK35_07110 [Saprospiraceae bacterium]|nr:hypothetical protein [Saprospiraceae bacterium]
MPYFVSEDLRCDRNVEVEFVNGISDTYKEICLGGSAPAFTATSSCYNWYANLGSTSPLTVGSATFTPTIGTGPGQLNNLVPGEYFWYLGDRNEINSNCRTKLTIKVNANIGTATANGLSAFVSNTCTMSANANLTTTASALLNNDIIGWWITEGQPITSTVTNDATLVSALSSATINGSISNPVNHLIQSTAGTPLKKFDITFQLWIIEQRKKTILPPVLAKYAAAIPDEVFNCTTKPSLCGNSVELILDVDMRVVDYLIQGLYQALLQSLSILLLTLSLFQTSYIHLIVLQTICWSM